MSTYPRLQSRVNVLERRQNVLEARIEELCEDTTASFKQLAEYRIQAERQIDTRFNQVDARVGELSRDMTSSFKQLVEYQIHTEDQIDTRFNQVDARLDKMEKDITEIKATMATKEDLKTEIAAVRSDLKNDMTGMENRIVPKSIAIYSVL